jgi:hypothetical protein
MDILTHLEIFSNVHLINHIEINLEEMSICSYLSLIIANLGKVINRVMMLICSVKHTTFSIL